MPVIWRYRIHEFDKKDDVLSILRNYGQQGWEAFVVAEPNDEFELGIIYFKHPEAPAAIGNPRREEPPQNLRTRTPRSRR